MDITKSTLEQLKSLAYDQMVELQRIQNNLQLINQEIANKQKLEPIKKENK